MSFEEFKNIDNPKPLNLQKEWEALQRLKDKLRDIRLGEIDSGIEKAATDQMYRCEELLRRSIPPNLELLRRCNVDTDALLSKLDAIDQGEKTIIAISSDLDDRILIQIERLLLSKLKGNIHQAYKAACMAMLVVILSNDQNPRRKEELEEFLEERERFFDEIGDEEGKRFVQDELRRFVPRQFMDYGVETFDDTHEEELIRITCPCCGQTRPCKPFSDVAKAVMISSAGRIPYQGILLCTKCESLRCGVNASWVIFRGREAELADMKARGMLPDEAQMYSAKCGRSGCDGDLYTLTEDLLLRIGEKNAR